MPRVRFDGGIIGSLNTPTTSVASGIWTVKDNEEYTRRGLWPSQGYPVGSINATMLIVAGGGGGGAGWGGGGGAGSITYNSNYILPTGTNYPIIIGAGGAASSTNGVKGSNGTSSSFYTLSSTGGGGGGSWDGTSSYPQTTGVFIGNQGASGGGTSSKGSIGGANTLGLGYAGGAGLSDNSTFDAGGGGGGAGGIGATATGGTGAAGGTGVAYNITGISIYYAGGGGGGSTGSGGAGGTGGGGAGGGTNSTPGKSANTGQGGGGGGGSVNAGQSGGAGGSGTVILSYPLPQYWTGGTVTNNNGTNVVHTFTTSANLVALATPIDTYQPYNTLLVHADGTNGANNGVFLDSSTNNLSITKTGTATQGTFSPFSTTGWSNYFNTSSDSYGFPSTAGMALGASGNATIECWAYFSALPASGAFIFNKDGAAGTNYPEYAFTFSDGSGTLNLELGVSTGASSVQGIPFGVIKTGTWYHIAACRTGATWTLFLNGSIVNTGTQTISPTARTNSFYVGTQLNGGVGALNGAYISNLRVIVGSTLYTSNFSPPLTALTNITNTVVLTCQNNKFVENINNGTITVTGTPQVQPFSPFNPTAAYSNTVVGGSAYFNGSSSYLTTSTSPAFDLSTPTSWTIEWWMYPTITQVSYILQNYTTSGATIYGLDFNYSSAGTISVGTYNGSSAGAPQFYLTYPVANNAWTHVAVVRNGSGTNNITLYINGAVANTGTYTTWPAPGNSTTYIGARNYTGVQNYFGGYISNLRSVIGNALYTSAFTPSSTPLTTVSNTAFLLNATNAGIIDSSQKNELITYGSAAISTTQSKFGGTSMYFDGSTGYLSNPSSTAFTFGPGDFTVEYWVYYNAISGSSYQQICGGSSTSAGFSFGLSSTPKLYMTTSSVGYTSTGTTLVTGQWYHVAFVRKSGTVYFYLNGVLDYSVSAATTITETGFGIGGGKTGAFFSSCYVDELRVTQGYARYTSNFTPQTTAFLNT